MKYLIQVLSVTIFALTLLSCAGRRQLPPVEVRGEEGRAQQEAQSDTVVVVDTVFVQVTPDSTDKKEWDVVEGRVFTGELGKEPIAAMEPRRVQGYRVQIFASLARDKAEESIARAKHSFTEKVYLEFEEPYYKVRVGNFTTKDEAKVLREKALSLGFKGSWIVESTIEH